MFEPTTGNRIRLADSSLAIEVERDCTVHREEVKFSGSKVIPDGMGQAAGHGCGGECTAASAREAPAELRMAQRYFLF